MSKLNLTFSGRQTNRENDLGAFVRVNLKNGNMKISPSVVKALGLEVKSKVNVVIAGEKAYIGENALGSSLAAKGLTCSRTHADKLGLCFQEQIAGNETVTFSVDVDAIIEAEDQDGNDVSVLELTFKSAGPAKKGGGKGKSAEDEFEDNAESPETEAEQAAADTEEEMV